MLLIDGHKGRLQATANTGVGGGTGAQAPHQPQRQGEVQPSAHDFQGAHFSFSLKKDQSCLGGEEGVLGREARFQELPVRGESEDPVHPQTPVGALPAFRHLMSLECFGNIYTGSGGALRIPEPLTHASFPGRGQRAASPTLLALRYPGARFRLYPVQHVLGFAVLMNKQFYLTS